MSHRARITVLTSGHLSTCPRMLKAADALSEAGYDVSAVATIHEPWAAETDVDVRSRREWPVVTVDYRRGEGLTYWRSGVRYRIARSAVRAFGSRRTPFAIVARAFGRVHAELVDAVRGQRPDLIYAGTTGALAAGAEAARDCGVPYGVDLEDLHHGETTGPDAALVDSLAMRVEERVLAGAAFVTTSSEMIADAYRNRYGIAPSIIHNTFPLPLRAPEFARVEPDRLRVYWFSQTIGAGRGLEDAILALGQSGISARLSLRGRSDGAYADELIALAARHAPRLIVEQLPPVPPDAMVDEARSHDVGLALEQMEPRNRRLCLTNKAFTYLPAGLAVAITDTPGQHALGMDLGDAVALVPPGGIDALATAFERWFRDPRKLACARQSAWRAACRRWHWEHDLERGHLHGLTRAALA